ncbi:hypothetical protein HDU91_000325 [Kappamyces sp. JEL0680]|nr:hypothetical protein HDU91_000325 [Kappamyces sp. JEL0680]
MPSMGKKSKKLSKPSSKPRLSIDTIAPLLQDRTDAQSPIKLDNPELPSNVPPLNGVVPSKSKENLVSMAAPVQVLIPQATTETDERKDEAPAKSESVPQSDEKTAAPVPNLITQVTQGSAPAAHLDLAAARSKVAAQVHPHQTPMTTDKSDKPLAQTPLPDPPQPSFLEALFSCCCAPSKVQQETVQLRDLAQSPTAALTPAIAATTPKAESPATLAGRLLPAQFAEHAGRKCLVLDLDETLLHSSFKARFCTLTPVEIDNVNHTVYVLKRPHVEEFLEAVDKIYELVVFTASLSKYADPVLDILDPKRLIKHRLFRESCTHHKGNYIKDLSLLGRDLPGTIIIDNSPTCYLFQPANAIPIASWFDDPNDQELLDLIPFLEDLNMVEDVRAVLDNSTLSQ